jgi:hypothetical protein
MIPLLPQKILFARIDKAEHVFLLQKEYVWCISPLAYKTKIF